MKNHIMIGDNKIMIDPEDHERVSQHKWFIEKATGNVRTKSVKLSTSLHKFIKGIHPKSTMTAYHINGNSWDNRQRNLKECTRGEAAAHARESNRNREDAVNANTWFTIKKISFI